MLGDKAIKFLLENYTFSSVLDVGSGEEKQADLFAKHGKVIYCVDYGNSVYGKKKRHHPTFFGDFMDYPIGIGYPCVWACHVLEHQPDVRKFLKRLILQTGKGGVLAITVPPLKNNIVGGHLTLWNAGLLLYNMVVAGLDCSEAKVMTYDYNITVIVEKKLIKLPELSHDRGDITLLKEFLPKGFTEGVDGTTL